MEDKEFNQKIFAALSACYREFGKYKNNSNASPAAIADAESIQHLILKELAVAGESTTSVSLENLQASFVKHEFSSDELQRKLNVVLEALKSFSSKYDPTTWQTAVNFITSWLPFAITNVTSPTPPAISDKLKDEIDVLENLKQELEQHKEGLETLEKIDDRSHAVQPFLTAELQDTDASKLITISALPQVEESMRINFTCLFEYVSCIELIKHKLSADVKNFKARELLEKVQNEILKQLNMSLAEFAEAVTDDAKYQQKEEGYIRSLISPEDCLNLERFYQSQRHVRKNMNQLFKVLSEQGGDDVALIASFKQGYKACEKNNDLMNVSLNNIRYLRDQAKNITHKLDHVLLRLPGSPLTINSVLSLFGIKRFIRKNFKEFSYKELSDLKRIRMSMEVNHLVKIKDAVVTDLPNFECQVNLGERPNFSYGMQTYQAENLKKYATLCTAQLQIAKILLDNIKTADPKLQKNLESLRKIFAEITELRANPPYQYNETEHRKLNDALNILCGNFYQHIEQLPMHLLTHAANIQRQIDYKLYANDFGNFLITNSSLHTYDDNYADTDTPTAVLQTVKGKVIGGLEWGQYSFVEHVGRNATQLFKDSNAELTADIKMLNHFAYILNNSGGLDKEIAGEIKERDRKFLIAGVDLPQSSYMGRFMLFVMQALAIVAAVLAYSTQKIYGKSNTATELPFPKKNAAAKTASKVKKDVRRKIDAINSSKKKLYKQLIQVQLDQQAEILAKSLHLAKAMRLDDTVAPIDTMSEQIFGMRLDYTDKVVLDADAKAYYKILALQEALKTIADPSLRSLLTAEFKDAGTLANMTPERWNEHIKLMINKFSSYGDQIKIDAFYNKCRERFEAKIGNKIDSKRLNEHGIAARETIKWLLSTPVVLEATKSIFMLSPFLGEALQNFKKHFLYRLLVISNKVRNTLLALSMQEKRNDVLEIFGSAKKAAEYYIYEYGEMRLDFACADRMMYILKKNKSVQDDIAVEDQPSLTTMLFSYLTDDSDLQESTDNPYTNTRATFLSSLQERSAWQLVEILETILRFREKLANKNEVEEIINPLMDNLWKLLNEETQNNVIARNRIINQTLPLLARLYNDVNLQKDPQCFEFLMLLRYAAMGVGTISNLSIKVEEYMSYHGVADFPKDDVGQIQKILDSLSIGDYLYKEIVNNFSGGAIVSMKSLLEQIPPGIKFSKSDDLKAKSRSTPV